MVRLNPIQLFASDGTGLAIGIENDRQAGGINDCKPSQGFFDHFRRDTRSLGQQDINRVTDGVDHEKDEDADADNQDHHEDQPSDDESKDAHNKCLN